MIGGAPISRPVPWPLAGAGRVEGVGMPARRRRVVLASGKRKTAIARAVIRPGKGRIRVNGVPIEIWMPESARWKMMEPLLLVGKEVWGQVDIDITVRGGGFMGQAEAVRMAIARGLYLWTGDERIRGLFIEYDRTMLAGDPRRKEPKKYGGRGARARFQTSYR